MSECVRPFEPVLGMDSHAKLREFHALPAWQQWSLRRDYGETTARLRRDYGETTASLRPVFPASRTHEADAMLCAKRRSQGAGTTGQLPSETSEHKRMPTLPFGPLKASGTGHPACAALPPGCGAPAPVPMTRIETLCTTKL